MRILVPFYGDSIRWRPMLDKWIAAYKALGLSIPWFALSDRPVTDGLPTVWYDVEPYRDLLRLGHPFDVKGALVCSALMAIDEPFLVLDADAFLLADPAGEIAKVAGAAIAMPLDHGALVYFRTPFLTGQWSAVRKTCAGVCYFGDVSARARLVSGYRQQFLAMTREPVVPWLPPLKHLVEQYAWSAVLHDVGGALLPHRMNWAVRHLGGCPGVVVNHDYGHEKWAGQRAPWNS